MTEDKPSRSARVRELFLELCDLPKGELQEQLTQACRGDHELYAELRSLLGFDDPSSNLETALATSRDDALLELSQAPDSHAEECWRAEVESAGFRLGELIGEGGGGRVFDAEQQSPSRRVAVKVLNARAQGFANEVALLTRLRHPGIVRILAASTNETPWLAMEWVDGLPIDHFFKERELDIQARMALFEEVVAIVAHAHENGVVHGDLKPQNILVTSAEGRPEGEPRLLDFGLGQAYEEGFLDSPRTMLLGGTPGYMAPELLDGSSSRPSPQADVFALGTLAAELFGTVPGLEDNRTLERCRARNPLQRPSNARELLDAMRSQRKRTEHAETSRSGLHEQELRAAERARDRAEGALAELERLLIAKPGAGGPDQRATELFENLSAELGNTPPRDPAVEGLLRQTLGLGFRAFGLPEPAVRELEQCVELRERAFGPEHEATLESLGWLAVILREQDATERLLPVQRRVAMLRDIVQGPNDPQSRIAHAHLGRALVRMGDRKAGERELCYALEGLRTHPGPDHDDTLVAEALWALSLSEMNEFAKAEELLRHVVAVQRTNLGPRHPETLKAENNLAHALARQGKHAQAEELFRQLLSAHHEVLGAEHWASSIAEANLGRVLAERGALEEAEDRLERAQRELAGKLGAEHLFAIVSRAALGECLIRRERWSDAVELFEGLVEPAERTLPATDVRRFEVLENLGRAHAAAGNQRKAARALRTALRGYEALPELYASRVASARRRLADLVPDATP